MAAIDGFSHMVVQVTDLDRSEAFYHDVLGLDLLGRDLVAEEGPNSLLAMNTRQRILLVQVAEVEPFRPNSNTIHHAWLLTIEQFERTKERMESLGYDISDSRAQFRALGENNMDIYDPDGHRYQIQAYGPETAEIIIDNVGKIECGKVEDFALGAVKPFVKGKFFLVRLEGGFLALSRRCTHLNGLLTWKKEHWHFYCPMHGAIYDRKGETVRDCRGLKPLHLHPVTITEDGTIFVEPDKVVERDSYDPGQLAPGDVGAVAE